MKKRAITFLLIVLAVVAAFPAQAQRPRKTPSCQATQGEAQSSITVAVTDKQSTTTSNPNNVLITLSLRFTNTGSTLIQFTNNNIALLDSAGKRYLVTRARFAETVAVSPGGSADCSRVFFEVPREARISEVILFMKGAVVARTRF
ncbi:MAG: hypothetical protein AB2L14_17510 [Candidatus Xenobiia bacterium LiM19]